MLNGHFIHIICKNGSISKNYPIKHNKIAFRNTYNLGWSTKKSEYTLEYLLKDGLVNDDNLSQIELRVQL